MRQRLADIKNPAEAGFFCTSIMHYFMVSTLVDRSSTEPHAASISANCACQVASAPCQATAFSIDSAEECTSTETTDIAALAAEFPGLLTPFAAFLDETGWGNATATYDDLARSL